jgi:hypothetical protein
MVHWGFEKSELLPLTFYRMRMKFRERISKILTGGRWDGILAPENKRLSPYKIAPNTQK